MAFNYSPKIVTDGLVLYLDAANTRSYPGVGTTWSDLSRSGNNGSLINGPTFNSTNGGSIVFDGVNDYVDVSSFVSNSQNMSFSVWINPILLPATIVRQPIFIQAEGGQTIRLYKSTNFAENNLAWLVYYERTNLGPGAVLPQFTYTLNTWTNTVLTFNQSGEYKVYINGTIWNTTPPAATFIRWLLPNGYVRLSSPASGFNGNISLFKIYNRTLTSQEVLQNYNATKTRYQ